MRALARPSVDRSPSVPAGSTLPAADIRSRGSNETRIVMFQLPLRRDPVKLLADTMLHTFTLE